MQKSRDISFLEDSAAYRRHGGAPAAPPSLYAGTASEWHNFKRGLDAKKLVPVRATLSPTHKGPAPRRPPLSGGHGLDGGEYATRQLGGPSAGPSPLPPPLPQQQWSNKGSTQNHVAALLFPSEARQIESAIGAGSGSGMALPPHDPVGASMPSAFQRPLNAVEVFEATSAAEPSGRAEALRLATSLAREVGAQYTPGLPPALTPRAAGALSAPTDPASASIVGTHQAILALSPLEVVPNQAELDVAAKQLVRQVGGHCTEQAILIEYLRRHHMAAAQTARALLQRLQLTVGMYEELRQAMDGSLLQRFQDSLGDAFAALRVDEVQLDGQYPGSGRRGSVTGGGPRGRAAPPSNPLANRAEAATAPRPTSRGSPSIDMLPALA